MSEELMIITTAQIFELLKRAPLPVLITQIKNVGNIQDTKLRRLWVTAKRAIDNVDQHLKEMASQNAQSR